MYYVGRLAKNNVQFDSCSGGKPFRFRVGSNEVIQGWDNGVAGISLQRRMISVVIFFFRFLRFLFFALLLLYVFKCTLWRLYFTFLMC